MKNFIVFTATCCLISALTTILIHNLPYVQLSFEETLLLYKSKSYTTQKVLIIVHCLLVLVSMLGIALVQINKSKAFTLLGFLFYTVFAFTEIVRQVLCLFYLNGIRKDYLNAESDLTKNILEANIHNFNHINMSLYTLFIMAFGIATLCYALSIITTKGTIIDNWIGYLLLVWSIGTFFAFINVFIQNKGLNVCVEVLNNYFQPLIRIILAIWLLRYSSKYFLEKKLLTN